MYEREGTEEETYPKGKRPADIRGNQIAGLSVSSVSYCSIQMLELLTEVPFRPASRLCYQKRFFKHGLSYDRGADSLLRHLEPADRGAVVIKAVLRHDPHRDGPVLLCDVREFPPQPVIRAARHGADQVEVIQLGDTVDNHVEHHGARA